MHIVYVCADPGVPVFGTKGASLHVREVVRVMARGHDVSLICARSGGEPPHDLGDVSVYTLPPVTGLDAAEREHAARRSAAAVTDCIAAAEAAHGPADLVYERYSLWSTGGMRAAAARAIPGVLEVNAPLIEEQARHRTLHDRRGAERVARTVLGDAAVVVAVSEPVAQWARRRSPSPARVHVVPNGVDPDRFAPPPTRTSDIFTVGFVGSLKAWHGTDLLVAAVRRLRHPPRLVIVGDGPERDRLEHLARPLGDRAVFTGALPPEQVPAALAQMDVTVAPYPRDATYFSPLKVFEYMAAGTAVVATAVGQIPSIIEHGRTGLLVRHGDPAALAGAIRRLQQEDLLRRSLGARARTVVRHLHSWTGIVEKILALARVVPATVIDLPDPLEIR